MKTSKDADALKNLIRRARERRDLKLEAVVKSLPKPHQGKARQWLHNIESGSSHPTVEGLVQLHNVLVGKNVETSSDSLTYWFFKLLVEKIPDDDPASRILVGAELARILEMDKRRSSVPRGRRTLEFFPEAFCPITIICGDRREPAPKTRGDLFAYSVSITDLTFILQLGLPPDTKIRSDKLFVLSSEESLKRLFGNTNLLVLGSPAVNFASRIINRHALFRFDLASEIKVWESQITKLTNLRKRDHLRVFAQMLKKDKPLSIDPHDYGNPNLSREEMQKLADQAARIFSGQQEKDILNGFRRAGLIDPADQKTHGKHTPEDTDFAVISVAKNPYAEPGSDFVALFAAGVHGPGTVQAVKALADNKSKVFSDHPFGGILEVQLNEYEQWSDRLENATWRWQTAAYTADKLKKNFETGLADYAHHEPARTAAPLSNDEIEASIILLARLTAEKVPTSV